MIQLDWRSIKVATLVTSQEKMKALLRRYGEVFEEGLGQMNTFQATLDLKPQGTPKFFKARSAPFAMKEAIETELDHLENAGLSRRSTTASGQHL